MSDQLTIVLAYPLKDTAFQVNAVDPGYTATDFNHLDGSGTVENAGKIIVKYATLNAISPPVSFSVMKAKQTMISCHSKHTSDLFLPKSKLNNNRIIHVNFVSV